MLNDLIDNVIAALDCNDDCLLIELLNNKKNRIVFEYGDQYKHLSVREIQITKKGMHKILVNFLSEQKENRIHKLKKIISRSNCDKCMYSIPLKHIYNGDEYIVLTSNQHSDRCKRCRIKSDIINNELRDTLSEIDSSARTLIESDKMKDYILIKSLVNKINTKLKKLTQNDAS